MTEEITSQQTIELNDGTELIVNPKINALTMWTLREKEGFKTKLILNAMIKQEDVDEITMIDAVFLAYRQANPDGMKYMDFLALYDFDLEEATPIFGAVVSRKARQKFAESFKKKTKAKK